MVWQSYQQDGSDWGVFGQRFNAAGGKLGGEFQVNTYTSDKQDNPAVAMDAAGDFVVTWASFGQDGSGYGIYARRYNAAGAALDAAEFRVNQTTLNWQVTPDVGMAANGNFDVTWSSFGQDNMHDRRQPDVRTTASTPACTTPTAPITRARRERRRRVPRQRHHAGDQVTPAVAMAANGTFVVAWAGPANDGRRHRTTDVFSRVIDPVVSRRPDDRRRVRPAGQRRDELERPELPTAWPAPASRSTA